MQRILVVLDEADGIPSAAWDTMAAMPRTTPPPPPPPPVEGYAVVGDERGDAEAVEIDTL